jgi:hypothetical protein
MSWLVLILLPRVRRAKRKGEEEEGLGEREGREGGGRGGGRRQNVIV